MKRDVDTATVGLGVEELWEQSPEFIARFPKFRGGLVVKKLLAEGPGAKAGIREGDLITAVSESPVKTRDEFLTLIRDVSVGSTLGLTVQRTDGSNKAYELISVRIR
jgi:S1-C subfamily serine protease